MGISQQAIADALGLSRTTVTKILNRDPKYSASEVTRELVYRTAERMGYDFTTIRRPFKREYGRTEVNAQCSIEIIMENDEIFDRGTAAARNIGVGGALLVNLSLPKNSLPLSAFTLRIKFLDIPELADLKAECQIVRLSDSDEVGQPQLGVHFINAVASDRALIQQFVERRAAENALKVRKAMRGGNANAASSDVHAG
jgi:transcriptional regulator with XRE-family HTH domain